MPAAPMALLPLAAAGDGFVREAGQGSTTCVGKNDSVCLGWAIDHLGDYVTPTLEHLAIVFASVVIGFAIAFALVVVSHRRRWLIPTVTGITGVIYTIPSIALFLLLLPISGRGNVTAVIALCLYTLQIIYRNFVTGLANVPASAKDAGRGMGMTDQQLFRQVELPLAVPEIVAGLRIATVSTVAIASLATFAGGGGLGAPLYFAIGQGVFKTGIFIPVVILLAMAVLLDIGLLLIQNRLSRWRSPGGTGRGRATFWRRILSTPQADPA
jgi:osmoprotectant transport system permease protein